MSSNVEIYKDSNDLEQFLRNTNLAFVVFLPDLQNTKIYMEYILTL